MELLLIRHGDAAMVAGLDADRPLTERGEAQAAALAAWMKGGSWQPDLILTSPYRRAQSTAKPLQELWPDVPCEQSTLLTPDAYLNDLVTDLESRNLQRLLLVSHNPLMSNFLNWLLGGSQQRVMGTATIARVEAEVLAGGCGQLFWMRHPLDYSVAAGR